MEKKGLKRHLRRVLATLLSVVLMVPNSAMFGFAAGAVTAYADVVEPTALKDAGTINLGNLDADGYTAYAGATITVDRAMGTYAYAEIGDGTTTLNSTLDGEEYYGMNPTTDNPKTEGLYEANYEASTDDEVDAEKTYYKEKYSVVSPNGTEDPSALGWYEKSGDVYTLTMDTTVNGEKTYYEFDGYEAGSPGTNPATEGFFELKYSATLDTTVESEKQYYGKRFKLGTKWRGVETVLDLSGKNVGDTVKVDYFVVDSSLVNNDKITEATKNSIEPVKTINIKINEKVAKPSADKTGGVYFETIEVNLTSATAGATIYYTTDETDPTSESTEYTAPITISEDTTLKAIAIKDGSDNSDIMTEEYYISQRVSANSISIKASSNEVLVGESVLFDILTDPAGANDLEDVNWTSSDTDIATVSAGGVLHEAYVTGVAEGTATISVKATTNDSVEISASANITVTTIPVETVTIEEPEKTAIEIGEELDLSALVTPDNATDKNITWTVSNGTIAKVTADPEDSTKATVSGLKAGKVKVTASSNTAGVSDDIEITVNKKKVAAPVAVPESGFEFVGTGEVVLTTETTGAEIHYTLDGTTPTASSNKYSDPITVSKNLTLKAIATIEDEDYESESEIMTATYTVAAPVSANGVSITPSENEVGINNTIEIEAKLLPASANDIENVKWTSADTDVATVSWDDSDSRKALKATVSGVNAGKTSVEVEFYTGEGYTVKYTASANITVKEISVNSISIKTEDDKDTIEIDETLGLEAVFDPENASYKDDIVWTISGDAAEFEGETAGKSNVVLKGVSDGSVKVTVSDNRSKKSDTKEFKITKKKVSVPVATPGSGTYVVSTNVTIATATSGAAIYVTKDNTEPKAVSENLYDGKPILVSENMIIRAIAAISDNKYEPQSEEMSAEYVIITEDQYVSINEIKLSKDKVVLLNGENYTLKATVDPKNATYRDVKFATSNEKVIKINSAENNTASVTAVGAGEAVVTASVEDKYTGKTISANATFTVSATSAVDIYNDIVEANGDDGDVIRDELEEDLDGVTLTELFDKVAKEDGTTNAWVGAIPDYTYTGAAIKPELHVYDGVRRLTAGTDYTVKFVKNKDAGTATAKVTFKGSYNKKTEEINFTIKPADLEDAEVVAIADQAMALPKKASKPAVDVTIVSSGVKVTAKTNSKKQIKIKGYYAEGGDSSSLAATVPAAAGTYIAVLEPVGSAQNFTGTGEAKIEIKDTKNLMSKVKITTDKKKYAFTGEAIEPVFTVKKANGGDEITAEDYDVELFNNVNPGKATAVFTAKGDKYVGSKIVNFTISAKSKLLTDGSIEAGFVKGGGDDGDEFSFVKGGVMPTVRLYDNVTGKYLKKGTDYTVKYVKNKAVGSSAVAKVTGKGSYKGTKPMSFKIVAKDLEELSENIIVADKVVSRKGYQKPAVTIVDTDGKKLGKNDFELVNYVEPADGSNVYTVTIKGKGNYDTGEGVEKTYKYIEAANNIGNKKPGKLSDQKFTGFEVTLGESELKKIFTDLELQDDVDSDDDGYAAVGYLNNVKVGKASVTVQGTGKLGGVKTVKFKIAKKDSGYTDIHK
ncbi:MAG: chitobiase/beta-hexosaminidase C-terminal domain-containing protein [Lachnospiraceae bacterium]|nr:chitobiase/beta-hexosaminidase C-terminal domain-containing protein [Lachnospiraceae bacterium]